MALRQSKKDWQRKQRADFQKENGFSTTSDYATGKLRLIVLERDNFCCVVCGMTDKEHRQTWNRPITVDHKDKNRSNNTMKNLQTLCLRCHGRKDISEKLIKPRLLKYKDTIMVMRKQGKTYQQIADYLGFSIGAVWKWVKRWEAT